MVNEQLDGVDHIVPPLPHVQLLAANLKDVVVHGHVGLLTVLVEVSPREGFCLLLGVVLQRSTFSETEPRSPRVP